MQSKYRHAEVGLNVCDLLVYESIIVKIKATQGITDSERAQTLNYLRLSGCRVGVILNFGKHRLEWERLVL
ncbi:MAG: GxxExxY protein [Opitutales bacterium]